MPSGVDRSATCSSNALSLALPGSGSTRAIERRGA